MSKPAKRKLTTKQAAFVQAYTDIESDTFGNASASARRAYPAATPLAANAIGNENIAKPIVRNEIERVLSHIGAAIEVRGKALSDILHSDTIGYTRTVYDKDTGETHQWHGPSHTAVIKAVDTLNKMSGLYSAQQAAANIAAKDELRRLMDKFLKPRNVTGRRGEGEDGPGPGDV